MYGGTIVEERREEEKNRRREANSKLKRLPMEQKETAGGKVKRGEKLGGGGYQTFNQRKHYLSDLFTL